MSRHVIARGSDASATEPGALFPDSDGLARWPIVGEDAGAVHTGFGIATLQPGGSAPAHVHSFEESVFLLEGEVILQTPDAAAVLRAGDYGLVPVGVPHAWRNESPRPARWADMLAPLPRVRLAADTFRVPDLPKRPAETLDVRDPRTRSYGSIRPEHMDPRLQSQELLAVSASMRTALLVYSGISVKMMVDSDLGAVLSTMFMVQYDADGAAGRHDHPFEETYLILDGVVDATFDDTTYRLEPGDVAWAGAGCVHGFAAQGEPVRWLETQAPQPPSRHSYRFARDWEHLSHVLEKERG
ncbi:MAG TPA: cupin domain-containing protein [Actinomycetes bacterium]|nr:cupin domain-containing protein [Actinomycetes bacterium]